MKKIFFMWTLILVFCLNMTLSGYTFVAAAPTSSRTLPEITINVPIITYHAINTNPKLLNDFNILPQQFEQDIRILKENGYTCIDFEKYIELDSLINQYKKKPTQEMYEYIMTYRKPVIITFDDGYTKSFEFALPVLKKYDFKATFSIVGKYADLSAEKTGLYQYSYADWDYIKKMSDSGYIDIASHSYDLHDNNGIEVKTLMTEGTEANRDLVRNDLLRVWNAIKEGTDSTAKVLAYPYGIYNSAVEKIVDDFEKEFSIDFVTLITDEGVNKLGISGLRGLKRINRGYIMDTGDLLERISAE